MRGRSILGRLFLLAAAALALLAIAGALAPRQFAASSGADSPILYTVARGYDPLAWIHGADRFDAGAMVFVKDSRGRHPLVPDFAASADPAVSFDAENVMFSGKQKKQDPWQIWEISAAGGKPQRITACADDCIRPFYLPGNRIVYAKKIEGRFVVEAATLADGRATAPVVRLTYGPGNSLPDDVLRDGRILFEAISAFGADGTPELYTIYSDGSGVESYRCDHGKARHAGKQMRSGDIVFASQSGLGRFTSALAQEVPISAPAGEYAGDVTETATGDWLVSWRSNANRAFQLMQWTESVGRPFLSAPVDTLRPAVVEANANVIQPTPITQRTIPKRHPSALHD